MFGPTVYGLVAWAFTELAPARLAIYRLGDDLTAVPTGLSVEVDPSFTEGRLRPNQRAVATWLPRDGKYVVTAWGDS